MMEMTQKLMNDHERRLQEIMLAALQELFSKLTACHNLKEKVAAETMENLKLVASGNKVLPLLNDL